MKLVSDVSRRFTQRPHYEPWELDLECEDMVSKLLTQRHGKIDFPISTSDLTLLIEQATSDFDSAADLSDVGDDVEGVTDFYRNKKPRVRIASHLWDGSSRENRLRTTLTHEFGHVHFHDYLYQVEASLELFLSASKGTPLHCNRQNVHGEVNRDWMEWQASYVSGAILMPVSAVRTTTTKQTGGRNLSGSMSADSAQGLILTGEIAAAFQVSADAARVRLSQLGFLEARSRPNVTLEF